MHKTQNLTIADKDELGEIVLAPYRDRNGNVSWEAGRSIEEDDASLTLIQALGRFLWALAGLTLRIVIWLIKWVLVIAFYAVVFGFFLMLFAVLFSL